MDPWDDGLEIDDSDILQILEGSSGSVRDDSRSAGPEPPLRPCTQVDDTSALWSKLKRPEIRDVSVRLPEQGDVISQASRNSPGRQGLPDSGRGRRIGVGDGSVEERACAQRGGLQLARAPALALPAPSQPPQRGGLQLARAPAPALPAPGEPPQRGGLQLARAPAPALPALSEPPQRGGLQLARAPAPALPPQRGGLQLARPPAPALLAPSEPPPPTLPYTIPGPARAVQKALATGMGYDGASGKMDSSLCGGMTSGEEDDDFRGDHWVRAVSAVDSDGITVEEVLALNFKGRVSKLVAIVETFTPNGLGDAAVTLKDPSGQISGTIHRKVLGDPSFGKDVEVGSVMVLQDVAVFRPTPRARYLNITVANVFQVFKKGNAHVPNSLARPEKSSEPVVLNSLQALEGGYSGSTTEVGSLSEGPAGSNKLPDHGEPALSELTAASALDAERMQAVAKAAGWDLDQDLDQLLGDSFDYMSE